MALLFSPLYFWLRPPWLLISAIAGALCGLISALMRHWALIAKVSGSFAAKILVVVVAASALFFSPWIANTAVSGVTLLRPSALPAAYSALLYIATVFLWAALVYCALFGVALFNLIQVIHGTAQRVAERFAKTEIIASFGRLAGLLVLLFCLAPMLLAGFDSDGVISRIVVMTSFVENGGEWVSISSIAPKVPTDCQQLAKEQHLDSSRPYVCTVRMVRCPNIDKDARIAFLDDKGAIAIATDVATGDILHELAPIRFDLAECKPENRYKVEVSQTPAR